MSEETPIQSGRYRHFKGNEYTVIGTARHSETLEEHVVYRQEYGEHGLWVRPKQMFSETVKVDGHEVPRFQPLASSSKQVCESVTNIFDDLPQHLPKEVVHTFIRSFEPPMCVSNESSPTVTPHPQTSGTTNLSMSGLSS